MNSIYTHLQLIFQECFDNKDLTINPETSSIDIPGWDSLMHVSLILAVEQKFDIRFRGSEVDDMKQVSDLAFAIEKHLSQKN